MYKGRYCFEKNNMRALVVATTLAIPFAVYSSPVQAAEKIAENKAGVMVTDRVYNVEIKIYKDQKDEPSMVSQYIKDPKVKIENGKKLLLQQYKIAIISNILE